MKTVKVSSKQNVRSTKNVSTFSQTSSKYAGELSLVTPEKYMPKSYKCCW